MSAWASLFVNRNTNLISIPKAIPFPLSTPREESHSVTGTRDTTAGYESNETFSASAPKGNIPAGGSDAPDFRHDLQVTDWKTLRCTRVCAKVPVPKGASPSSVHAPAACGIQYRSSNHNRESRPKIVRGPPCIRQERHGKFL